MPHAVATRRQAGSALLYLTWSDRSELGRVVDAMSGTLVAARLDLLAFLGAGTIPVGAPCVPRAQGGLFVVYRLTAALSDYAGFGPGVIVSVVVSLATGGWAGRRLGVGRLHGTALVLSLGVILSATVTPSHDALVHGAVGSGACDLSRIGPASLGELVWPSETLLNILLFVPLGVAIGLCPWARPTFVVAASAFVLPFAIELIQMIALQFGRECQSADIFDNLTGLTLGIVAAIAARRILSEAQSAGASGTGQPT